MILLRLWWSTRTRVKFLIFLIFTASRNTFGGTSEKVPPKKPFSVEKGFHAPLQGVRGAAAPRMVTKFNILKINNLLENSSFYPKLLHFPLSKLCIS